MIVVYKDGSTCFCDSIDVYEDALYLDDYRTIPLDEVLKITEE